MHISKNRPNHSQRNKDEPTFRQKRIDGVLKVKLSIRKQLLTAKQESKQLKREWLVCPNVLIVEITDAALLV